MTGKKLSLGKATFVVLVILSLSLIITWFSLKAVNHNMLKTMENKVINYTQSVAINQEKNIFKIIDGKAVNNSKDLRQIITNIWQISKIDDISIFCRNPTEGVIYSLTRNEVRVISPRIVSGNAVINPEAELLRAFNNQQAQYKFTENALWDEWTTVYIPAIDPLTDELIGVISLKNDIFMWRLNLLTKLAIPLGILYLFMIMGGVYFINPSKIRLDRRLPNPMLRLIVTPLLACLLIMISGLLLVLLETNLRHIAHHSESQLDAYLEHVETDSIKTFDTLTNLASIMAKNTALTEALLANDRQALQLDWQQTFEWNKYRDNLSHLSFLRADHTVLLRMHFPQKYGDQVKWFTLLEAQRTGQVTSGLEIGKFGSLTLRVVHPVFKDGSLQGYIELGNSLENVLSGHNTLHNTEAFVSIYKRFLGRSDWEEGKKVGNKQKWDEFEDKLVTQGSNNKLSTNLRNYIQNHKNQNRTNKINSIFESFAVYFFPIYDVTDTEVGGLYIANHDMGKGILGKHYISMLVTMPFLIILIFILYLVFRQADKNFLVQFNNYRQLAHDYKQQQWRLHYILKGINAGTWEWNIQTGDVKINSRWAEIIGYSLDELAPFSIDIWRKNTLEEDLKRADQLLAKHHNGESDYYECQFRMKHKNGDLVWVQDRGQVISRTDEGKPLMMYGTHNDITKQKQAELKVVQSSKLASLGEMATGVAHELNQPLNVIRMASGNILRKLRKGPVNQDYLIKKLERIEGQTTRAASVIDHMRMFGRKASHTLVKLNPVEIVHSVLGLIGEQLRLTNIDIKLECPESCPQILGEQILVEQVLLNLITNARDAILSNESQQNKCIQISINTDVDGHVVIAIEDTGGGIDKKLLSRIFEPFFSTKGPGNGTGLGLSISQDIIKELQGHLTVMNTDLGARFMVQLPFAT